MSEWDRRGRGNPSDESHRAPGSSPSDPYEDLRPLLISIAYRMVGSYSEAEDLVQEAFVRFHQATRRDPTGSAPAHGAIRLMGCLDPSGPIRSCHPPETR